jgi:hypothetical protein
MKNISIAFTIGLITILASFVSAKQSSKPNIAVYVAAGNLNEAEIKMLGTKVLAPFVQSGRYRTIERSDAFLGAIARERQKQRDGSVDDSQISRLGKEAGIDLVCVTDFVNAFGIYSVSARLINTETAEIIGMGETEMKSLNEIGVAADRIFEQLEGRSTNKSSLAATAGDPAKTAENARNDDSERVRIGFRAGFYSSELSKMDFFDDEFNTGFGLGIGLVLKIPFSSKFSLNLEPSFYYRSLTSFKDTTCYFKGHSRCYYLANEEPSINELIISTPILLSFMPTKILPFYLTAGIQIDVPLETAIENDGKKTDLKNYRASMDMGVNLGIGFLILSHFGFDARYVIGLTDLFEFGMEGEAKKTYGTLSQAGIGMNILF